MSSRLSLGNSRVEIELRKTGAELSRETQRLRKNCQTLQRQHGQNMRKLGSYQRSLMMLVGKDPYPDCTRDETLFEYNQPGFCYQRDGKPRYLKSLQESSTRRIFNDMDGRQGLQSDPAINVVSDTPMMAEVLSCPEIVQILCELRNTAALMSDETLFSQFAIALAKSKQNTLVGFDGPMDYLKQYRRNLIQEFFDTLKMEAEMRFMMVPDDPTMSFYKEPGSNRTFTPGSTLFTEVNSNDGSNNDNNMTIDQWNQAVMESLRKAQEEEIKEHCPTQEPGEAEKFPSQEEDQEVLDRAMQLRIQRQMLGLAGVPSLYSNRAIGFDKYLEENRKERLNKKNKSQTKPHNSDQQAELIYTKPSNEKKKPSKSVVILAPYKESGVGLAASRSDRRVTFQPETREQSRRQQRREFDTFVRQLIAQIETLDQMGRGLLVFQKKRPTKHDHITDPLVKLLKKQSLFSSLTDDDVLFYEVEGGRKGVEELLAQQLGTNLPRPGAGFTYKVPTPAHDTDSSDFTAGVGLGQGSIRHSRTKMMKELEEYEKKRMKMLAQPLPCTKCDQVSMKKVCCSACREKVKLACAKMQKRDNLCKITRDAYSWKVPEVSMWPRHTRAQIEASRPSMGESMSARDLSFMKENRSKSVYLIPPPTNVEFRKGAPTPRFPRNPILPATAPLEERSSATRFIPGKFTSSGYISQQGRRKPSTVAERVATARDKRNTRTGGASTFISRVSTAAAVPIADISSTSVNAQPPPDSWTLKVSKMDIMKLRHELETEVVKDKMAKFEEKYLKFL